MRAKCNGVAGIVLQQRSLEWMELLGMLAFAAQELVEKKMELAELHEQLLMLSHAHAHGQHTKSK